MKKPRSRLKKANEVADFLATLRHPLRKEIDACRAIILGASAEISEAIKWNAPSYRVHGEFFATFNLRAPAVQLVFHTGAKVKAHQKAMLIPDPAGLLDWRTKDRCLVTLDDVDEQGAALAAIVRAWTAQLAPGSATLTAQAADLPRTIGSPATRALTAAGYTTLHALTQVTEEQLLALHGVGPRAVKLLAEALAERQHAFRASGRS